MAESCTNFTPNLWKPNICCDCNKKREDHPNVGIFNEDQIPDNQSFTSDQLANDNVQTDQSDTTEHNSDPSVQAVLPPCPYGLDCYRTNPHHFEHLSHPPGHERRKRIPTLAHQAVISIAADDETTADASNSTFSFDTASRQKTNYRKKLAKQKQDELRFIEQVESRVHELNALVQSQEQEIDKLSQDRMNIIISHQNLEKVLTDEVELAERRELEQKRMLAVPQQMPSYWGPNAFSESYREIEISHESPEFHLINDLLNSTITTHDNRYGTIYGKDPTEFLVTRIKRIQNAKLWHEYCFKKDSIIRKNNDRLSHSGGSLHLEKYPLLTPLLDSQANEYWLFHGCSHDTLPYLLHTGYDPRVSSLKGMFGGGFYLAENSSKSNQYILCPQCNANSISTSSGCNCPDQDSFVFSMVLYRAILGDVHVALQYDKEKYRDGFGKGNRVRRPPMKTGCNELYDSVMGESIKNGGDRLHHREFILYERGQAYPEYVIDFRRSAQNARPPTDMENLKNRCRNFLRNTFRSVPE